VGARWFRDLPVARVSRWECRWPCGTPDQLHAWKWFLLRGAGLVLGLVLYPAALQLYNGLVEYIFVDFATGACCMLEIVGIAGIILLFKEPAKTLRVSWDSIPMACTSFTNPTSSGLGLRIRELPIWMFLLICIPTLVVISAWGMLLEKASTRS